MDVKISEGSVLRISLGKTFFFLSAALMHLHCSGSPLGGRTGKRCSNLKQENLRGIEPAEPIYVVPSLNKLGYPLLDIVTTH